MNDKQILRAVQDMFQSAGTPLDQDAVEFALRMVRDPQFNRVAVKPHQITNAFLAASFIVQAKGSSAIRTPEQLDQFLQTIRKQVPTVLRPAVKQTMKDMLKDLPRKPSTGRIQSLTLDQKKEACDFVSRYHRDGNSMRSAYQRVADQLGVSARTVQRAWKSRGELVGETTAETVPRTAKAYQPTNPVSKATDS